MNRQAEINARKVEIRGLLEGNQPVDLNALETELRALEAEEAELRRRQEMAQGIHAGTVPTRTVATIGTQEPERRDADPHDTPEYRKAFMDYVTRGVKSDVLEFRADATTGTGDIGAVIPTTVLNKIVEKMKDFGMIWSRVTKTGIKGGVQVPLASAKPTATWVTAGTMADKQKKQVSGSIIFSYYKLQCRVAVELVAETVAMPVFEATVSDNIYEAMIMAIETAIISGDGVGEPLGITKDTNIPAAQVVEMTVAEFGQWAKWTALMGKMPRRYRGGATLILNDADWNKYIAGMTDANGQPVARTTMGLDGAQQERFNGKEVIPVEEYLSSIDDAAAGDVIGIYCKLSDYMFNSNMALTFRRYFNEDTDEWISKATLIADGKLADRNGVVLIKKK